LACRDFAAVAREGDEGAEESVVVVASPAVDVRGSVPPPFLCGDDEGDVTADGGPDGKEALENVQGMPKAEGFVEGDEGCDDVGNELTASASGSPISVTS